MCDQKGTWTCSGERERKRHSSGEEERFLLAMGQEFILLRFLGTPNSCLVPKTNLHFGDDLHHHHLLLWGIWNVKKTFSFAVGGAFRNHRIRERKTATCRWRKLTHKNEWDLKNRRVSPSALSIYSWEKMAKVTVPSLAVIVVVHPLLKGRTGHISTLLTTNYGKCHLSQMETSQKSRSRRLLASDQPLVTSFPIWINFLAESLTYSFKRPTNCPSRQKNCNLLEPPVDQQPMRSGDGMG